MTWAKVAAVLGSVLVVVSFCIGTDTPIAVTADNQSFACGDVITSAMLVSGQGSAADAHLTGRTRAEKDLAALVDARCHPRERRARWMIWGGIGLGSVLVLAGWTVLRERELDATSSGNARLPLASG